MRTAPVVFALCWLTAIPGFGQQTSRVTSDSSVVMPAGRLVVTADAESVQVMVDGHGSGMAPLILDSLPPGSYHITAFRPGAASWFTRTDSLTVALAPGESREITMSVFTRFRLVPASLPDVSPLLRESEGLTGRKIALYASGGVAVVAGVAAAYFKINADDRNDAYHLTGNPSLLDERRRLDTSAGIAFAATQIGFAIFSYLLLSD